MYLYYIPFPELIKNALSASLKTKTDAFLFFLSGRKEAEFFNNELVENWSYIDDITADNIIVFTPSIVPSQKEEWREWAGRAAFVKNGNFNTYSEKWENEFYNTSFSNNDKLIELYDLKNVFEFDTGGIKRERRLLKKQEKIDYIISQTKEIADYLNIEEKYLPAFLLFAIEEKKLFVVSISTRTSSYSLIRNIMKMYSPISLKRKSYQTDLKNIIKDIKGKYNPKEQLKKLSATKQTLISKWTHLNKEKRKEIKKSIIEALKEIILSINNKETKEIYEEYLDNIARLKNIDEIFEYRNKIVNRLENETNTLNENRTEIFRKLKISIKNDKELDMIFSINRKIEDLNKYSIDELIKLKSKPIISELQKLNTFPEIIEQVLHRNNFSKKEVLKINNNLLKEWEVSNFISSDDDFEIDNHTSLDFVLDVCSAYKTEVEINGRLNEINKSEKSIQNDFYHFIKPYCDLKRILINREVQLFNGRVDFQLIENQRYFINLEIKLSTNPNLIYGLTRQLTTYNNIAQTQKSIYVVFNVNNKNMDSLKQTWEEMEGLKPELVIINVVTNKETPSKLK